MRPPSASAGLVAIDEMAASRFPVAAWPNAFRVSANVVEANPDIPEPTPILWPFMEPTSPFTMLAIEHYWTGRAYTCTGGSVEGLNLDIMGF